MSNFKDSPLFSTHNDYYTPKSAWEQIAHLIPVWTDLNDRFVLPCKKITREHIGGSLRLPRIYEAFMLGSNEQSKKYLTEMGFVVKGSRDYDFLADPVHPSRYEIVVSNPPFERIRSYKKRKSNLKYKCIAKLLENDKPFIIILNSTNIFSRWFKELASPHEEHIKFIFPSKKIQFDKYEQGGETPIKQKGSCSFNSIYVCYKVLEKNVWI